MKRKEEKENKRKQTRKNPNYKADLRSFQVSCWNRVTRLGFSSAQLGRKQHVTDLSHPLLILGPAGVISAELRFNSSTFNDNYLGNGSPILYVCLCLMMLIMSSLIDAM